MGLVNENLYDITIQALHTSRPHSYPEEQAQALSSDCSLQRPLRASEARALAHRHCPAPRHPYLLRLPGVQLPLLPTHHHSAPLRRAPVVPPPLAWASGKAWHEWAQISATLAARDAFPPEAASAREASKPV